MARPTIVFPEGELSPEEAARKDALERNRRWYARNKEEQRKRVLAWQQANPGKVRAARKSWAEKNREHITKRDRLRYVNDRARELARAHKWRSMVAGAPGDGVSKAQWLEILEVFGGKCAYCVTADGTTMDHIVPISCGGAHDPENVVPACRSCNPRKSDSSLLRFVSRGGGVV